MRRRQQQPDIVDSKVERAIFDAPGWTYGYEIYHPDHPELLPRACGFVWKNGVEVYSSGHKELVLAAEPPERGNRERDEAFAARVAKAEATRRELNTDSHIWPAQLLADMEAIAREQSQREREQASIAESVRARVATQEDADLAVFLACERGRLVAAQRGILLPAIAPLPPRPQEQAPSHFHQPAPVNLFGEIFPLDQFPK